MVAGEQLDKSEVRTPCGSATPWVRAEHRTTTPGVSSTVRNGLHIISVTPPGHDGGMNRSGAAAATAPTEDRLESDASAPLSGIEYLDAWRVAVRPFPGSEPPFAGFSPTDTNDPSPTATLSVQRLPLPSQRSNRSARSTRQVPTLTCWRNSSKVSNRHAG